MADTRQAVYELVSSIPHGKVTTYGLLAEAAGVKNPRLVGHYLHQNLDPDVVPCHRVVNSQGKLAGAYAFGGADIQRHLLESEGVIFKPNGAVDFKQSLWQP